MKKQTRILLTTVALLLLIPVVAFGAMQWRGSQNVTNTKNNLTLIQQKITNLENDKGDHKQELREIQILLEQEQALCEQRERELADKQQEINNKQKEIMDKIAEIQQKNQQLQTKENELQQALRDIQEIERITEEMVEKK